MIKCVKKSDNKNDFSAELSYDMCSRKLVNSEYFSSQHQQKIQNNSKKLFQNFFGALNLLSQNVVCIQF